MLTPVYITFFVFSALLVAASLCVMLMRNPVHAALCLIFAFLNAAGLFLMLGAEFIAFSIVIVYVGAVAVLFLFVVMMLHANGDVPVLAPVTWPSRLVGMGFGAALFVNIAIAAWAWKSVGAIPVVESAVESAVQSAAQVANAGNIAQLDNTKALGSVLYTEYLFVFQAIGFILLIAMVGAIVLTLRASRTVRHQDVGQQLGRTVEEELVLHNPTVGEGVTI